MGGKGRRWRVGRRVFQKEKEKEKERRGLREREKERRGLREKERERQTRANPLPETHIKTNRQTVRNTDAV